MTNIDYSIPSSCLVRSIYPIFVYLCTSGYLGDRMQRPMKESQENQQNAETQRERYYATIHKVALQQAANTGGGPDKIPGEPLLRYGRQPGLVL